MRRLFSEFERTEVLIERGQSVESFLPALRADNTGKKQLQDFQPGDCATGNLRGQAALMGAIQASLEVPGSPRQQLFTLQAAVGELPPVDCPLQHLFAPAGPGLWLYSRTIFLPAGSVIIGKIHKHAHPNILSQGRVLVFTESGGSERLEGPLSMVSAPGTKRAVYAETDTIWTTIHLTTSTDLAIVEAEVIASDYSEYAAFIGTQE